MKALHKNIIREIQRSKSRFFSIMAIMALSTGFFTGIKCSSPSLIETGRKYFDENNLMDIRLVSTVGFDDNDIDAINDIDCTVAVMPSYMCDLSARVNDAESTIRVHALPERTETNAKEINAVDVIEGRLPEEPDECVIDSYNFNANTLKIGDTIKFNETVSGNKTLDQIKHLEYKIVGTVRTPMYITYQRGNTNIGSGALAFYIMINPEEFVSERYTCVYVQTDAAANGVSDTSEEYKNKISEQELIYEELADKRVDEFNKTTYADAKKKYDDAIKEFSEKKTETENELIDGEKKLHKGELEADEKLLEAEQKLADGEKELEDAKNQLEEGKLTYSLKTSEAKQKLAEAQQQYNDGKAAYEKAQLEYDISISQAQSQLDRARSKFNTQYTLFYGTTKPQAETKLTLLKAAIDVCQEALDKTNERIRKLEQSLEPAESVQNKLDELKEKLSEYEAKIKEYNIQYEEGTAALTEGERKLNEAKQQLDDAQAEFDTKKAESALQLGEAKIQLETAEKQLEEGRFEYETGLTTGMFELQEAMNKITEGEKKLELGRRELNNQKKAAMEELKSSREQLESGKITAKTKLDDAARQLSDAKDMLEKIEDAKWYVYDRDDNPGFSGLGDDAKRVDSIATVFPVFFLLVSLLVCLTTMTRMVEERRTEIGTLKALGYSDAAIAFKYFIYASSASVIGSILGSVVGVATLPYIIVGTYGIMYILPDTTLVVSVESFIISTLLGLVCTCSVATFACLSELRIRPATLMRPKAPKPGKRILLERIRPIWNHMNFTSKLTARNLFRYKARFLMTVIGVAGCTALIIGGMGLKDSISVVADRQYNEISLYDQVYALNTSGSTEEKQYLMSQFHKDKSFKNVLLTNMKNSHASFGKNVYNNDMSIVVPDNIDDFKKMFVLRRRTDHSPISLDDEGIVITERLSQVLDCKLGDEISFDIGDDPYKAKVSGITENYANNYIYLTKNFYENLVGKPCKYNVILTQLSDGAIGNEHDIMSKWIQNDDILTVLNIQDQVDKITSTLQSLDVIVFMLIVCAGMLAMVVLYNLTNINIAERVREIATIKVLGFYNLETANYIYRENMVLTIVGALVGLPLGTVFSVFITFAIQMDIVMYPQNIEPISYVLGFLLTIAFSVVVNFIMYYKMKSISMVESLKSIE